jgi:hypothetical protein
MSRSTIFGVLGVALFVAVLLVSVIEQGKDQFLAQSRRYPRNRIYSVPDDVLNNIDIFCIETDNREDFSTAGLVIIASVAAGTVPGGYSRVPTWPPPLPPFYLPLGGIGTSVISDNSGNSGYAIVYDDVLLNAYGFPVYSLINEGTNPLHLKERSCNTNVGISGAWVKMNKKKPIIKETVKKVTPWQIDVLVTVPLAAASLVGTAVAGGQQFPSDQGVPIP